MRIQHNIMSMNAYRNYNTNTSALSKNLEKLSSGYKINRAGDDAAGLAISEKMRAQIQGLNAAQKNVKDGISFVKTAEGAMQEIQDMLSRMKYLATQSANGTYEDTVDRKALQDEVDSLLTEIDRIADSANFNDIFMLSGGNGSTTTAASPLEATVDATNAAKLGDVTVAFADGATDEQKAALNEALAGDLKFTTVDEGDNNWGAGDKIQIDKLPSGYTATFKDATGADAALTAATDITVGNSAGDLGAADDLEITLSDADGNAVATITVGQPTAGASGTTTVSFAEAADAAADGTEATDAPSFTEDTTNTLSSFNVASIDFGDTEITEETDVKMKYDGTNKKLEVTIGTNKYTSSAFTGNAGAGDAAPGTEVTLTDANGKTIKVTLDDTTVDKIGADQTTDINEVTVGKVAPAAEDEDNTAGGGIYSITLQIGDTAKAYNQMTMNIQSMKTASIGVAGLKIDTITNAQGAIDTIKNAINTVSSVRGQLGAYQNRLEHTANNLSVMTENIQDAESTIRDTDVADEMMAYTKNNILIQSAQAMLAQANAVPQGVLQLLQ